MSSVAVKNPETSRAGPLDRLHLGVLAGVLYVVGSLAILFELLPWLWWAPGPLGFAPPAAGNPAVGSTIVLLLLGLAVAAGLVYLGTRLLGPSPALGVKAGIFTGLVTLLVIVLVTRWISLLFEGWVYDSRALSEPVGIILTVAVAVALLVLAGRFIFLAPSFGAKMAAFEEQGWFSATSFKRSQGLRVRRGTILGILILVGCGIYALSIGHQALAGAGNWGIAIPFTGKAEIRSLNDARLLYAGKRPERNVEVALPDRAGENPLGISKESRPELNEEGKPVGVIVTSVLPDSPAWKAGVRDGDTVNSVDGETVPDIDSLRERVEAALEKHVATVQLHVASGSGFIVSQTEFRDLNIKLRGEPNTDRKGEYLKITDRGDSSFEPGQVVAKTKILEEQKRLAEAKERDLAFKTPDAATASFPYATLPLLPHVKYTLPILLAALGLWLAWRVVNVPSFADFLIATEAELNKVSWTTRPRLVQDTIVVLVTVFLFTVFLFVVDVAWGQLLSWKPVGVLKLPEKGQGSQAPDQNW
ncbi:MAG TPA: preprotein translocase subunit SecE [Gemmataceae bacterium]|nr:preprotein translocase subunit SecE [Gemmataceae bacterium]